MATYPKSPKEMTKGMMYFPRMLDKIRLHARGELHEDYHKNLGAVKAADGCAAIFYGSTIDIFASACCRAGPTKRSLNGVLKKAGA
jgi:hypothetical protein